jgi:uncharacterized membrane protein (DUF485 family)
MSDKNSTRGGIGIGMVLFVVFLVLKLTGNIDWSWWWVTAPLWGPITFIIVFAIVVFVIATIFKGND